MHALRDQSPVALGKIGVERRTAQRIVLSGVVYFRDRQISGSGLLRNISESGALIVEPSDLPAVGSVLSLLLLTEHEIKISASCEVVRLQEKAFGVRFVDLDPGVQRILRSVCRSEQS